ncbi:MAG: GntR family transcriptional regulator [Bifidobacteriaceae bacterium]|nr:GntR family transcriptional regulator [Bifidobacteriaceae bacterium]
MAAQTRPRDPAAKAKGSISDGVYRQLRGELLTSAIPPGSRLMEVPIAERLGVSRTPVREALRRLESDGFVQRIGQTKLVATAVGPDDIGDIGLLRVELEGLAARLAVARGTPERWEQLAALARALATATSDEDLSARHLAFHRAVYATGFGPRMLRFVENHVLPYLELTVNAGPGKSPDPVAASRAHLRYLASLSSGDVERAVKAAREHAASGLKAARLSPA